jgi:hypothetical protein
MEEAQRGDTRMGAGMQGNAWFGSVKAASTLAKQGYKAVLQIKTEQGLYPKKHIETVLEGHWVVFGQYLKLSTKELPLLQLDTGIVHGQLCFSLPQRMQVQLDLQPRCRKTTNFITIL